MRTLTIAGLALAGLTACSGAPKPTPGASAAPLDVRAGDPRPGEDGCMVCGLRPDFAADALTSVTLTSTLTDNAKTFSYVGAELHIGPSRGSMLTIPVDPAAMVGGKLSMASDDFTTLKKKADWAGAEARLVVEFKSPNGGTDFVKWGLDIAD